MSSETSVSKHSKRKSGKETNTKVKDNVTKTN